LRTRNLHSDSGLTSSRSTSSIASIHVVSSAAVPPMIARYAPPRSRNAASELAPHAIAFYLRELAGEFHSYYNAERILVDDEALRAARLALCAAVRQTLANGLSLLGVSAPEKM